MKRILSFNLPCMTALWLNGIRNAPRENRSDSERMMVH
jgi:hypothetical protein